LFGRTNTRLFITTLLVPRCWPDSPDLTAAPAKALNLGPPTTPQSAVLLSSGDALFPFLVYAPLAIPSFDPVVDQRKGYANGCLYPPTAGDGPPLPPFPFRLPFTPLYSPPPLSSLRCVFSEITFFSFHFDEPSLRSDAPHGAASFLPFSTFISFDRQHGVRSPLRLRSLALRRLSEGALSNRVNTLLWLNFPYILKRVRGDFIVH